MTNLIHREVGIIETEMANRLNSTTLGKVWRNDRKRPSTDVKKDIKAENKEIVYIHAVRVLGVGNRIFAGELKWI